MQARNEEDKSKWCQCLKKLILDNCDVDIPPAARRNLLMLASTRCLQPGTCCFLRQQVRQHFVSTRIITGHFGGLWTARQRVPIRRLTRSPTLSQLAEYYCRRDYNGRLTTEASSGVAGIWCGAKLRENYLSHIKPGIERVQALANISRSALCCHSNETRAPI